MHGLLNCWYIEIKNCQNDYKYLSIDDFISNPLTTAAEVSVRPENSPLKTVVGQTAHFLVKIDSIQSVPWKSVEWYRVGS